jgi:hypothetical protein
MNATKKGTTVCPAAVAEREPCRYTPAPGATYCRFHGSPPPDARPVNRVRWCRLTARGSGDLLCQRPVLVGSDYCEKHDPGVKAERQEREARAVLLMALGGHPGALVALLLAAVYAGRVDWRELHRLALAARLVPSPR